MSGDAGLRETIEALTPMVSDEWPTTGEWLHRGDVLAVLAAHPAPKQVVEVEAVVKKVLLDAADAIEGRSFLHGTPAEWLRVRARDFRLAASVSAVEPGCTCGGMAACQQCQARDAALAAHPAPTADETALVADIRKRHTKSAEKIELMLHAFDGEECEECSEGDGHAVYVCDGCYPSWDGMDGHMIWPCTEIRAVEKFATAPPVTVTDEMVERAKTAYAATQGSYCETPMRGVYGVETTCARPLGHKGDHYPITNSAEWPDPMRAALSAALTEDRCACNPAEVENGACVLCGKPYPVGGGV